MSMKWIGAILVVASCAGAGFGKAAAHRREEQALGQLIVALELMRCELQYHLSPLPELCRLAAEGIDGLVKKIFLALAKELDAQIAPDANTCMQVVLQKQDGMPVSIKEDLLHLGASMGKFDVSGQLAGLETVSARCKADLDTLMKDRDVRLRGYQTLGICAGLALAILFL